VRGQHWGVRLQEVEGPFEFSSPEASYMIDTSAASRSFYSCCCSRFVVVAVTPTPPPFPVVPIQEATPAAEVDALVASAGPIMAPSSLHPC